MRSLGIACALGLAGVVALAGCNTGPKDKGGSGGMNTISTTATGDGDGDTTGDGDGDGDGDTVCGGVPVPDWVPQECILAIISVVSRAILAGNPNAVEEACMFLREALALEAIHSALGIPGPVAVRWLAYKVLFIQHFTPGDASGEQPRELDELGLQIEARTIEEDFPCGDGPNGFTICGTQPWVDGDIVVAAGAMEEDIPLDQTEWNVELSLVVDADGNPDNNYVADPNYPNDFFQDTDQWYVARYAPGGGWQLASSTAVDSNIQPLPSAARIVILGNAVMWIIPASELGVACPEWRMTSFAHKGDYGLNPPNEWGGRLEPPVDMGLNDCG